METGINIGNYNQIGKNIYEEEYYTFSHLNRSQQLKHWKCEIV
jgi:hypothetical protein